MFIYVKSEKWIIVHVSPIKQLIRSRMGVSSNETHLDRSCVDRPHPRPVRTASCTRKKMQNMTCPIETGYTYEGLFICGGLQCGKTQNQKPSQFCQEWSNCAYHGIHWWLISPSIGQSPFMAGEPPLIRDGLYPVDSQLTKRWDLIILIEYLELSGHIWWNTNHVPPNLLKFHGRKQQLYPNLGVSKAQPPLMTMAGGIALEGLWMCIKIDKWVITCSGTQCNVEQLPSLIWIFTQLWFLGCAPKQGNIFSVRFGWKCLMTGIFQCLLAPKS